LSTKNDTAIEIRRLKTEDLEQLQIISRLTFYETFSLDNSKENMKKYLDSEFSSRKLKAELADKNSEFYFATLENKVTGYLKINFGPSQTEINDQNSLEIERIYILKEFHRKKIGQLLFDKAVEIAKQKKVDYILLGVWEENQKAIRFYKKNGFVEFDKHIFKLGDDEQVDLMMKMLLNY